MLGAYWWLLHSLTSCLDIAKRFSLPGSSGRRGACSHGRFPWGPWWGGGGQSVVERGGLPSHSLTQVRGCPACGWCMHVCMCVCVGGKVV